MSFAQKMAAVAFLCAAGWGGLCDTTDVCGVHSWGQSPGHSPESMPTLSPPPGAQGHLSLAPRSKLLGSWSLGLWSHFCSSLAMPHGSATPPPWPQFILLSSEKQGSDPSITRISDHKERLREVQENREPVSEFLASLCPLVGTSSLAPRRK